MRPPRIGVQHSVQQVFSGQIGLHETDTIYMIEWWWWSTATGWLEGCGTVCPQAMERARVPKSLMCHTRPYEAYRNESAAFIHKNLYAAAESRAGGRSGEQAWWCP
jgi:hypothetical protein